MGLRMLQQINFRFWILNFEFSTFPKLPLKLQNFLFAPSILGIFNCESCDYSCENKQTFDNHMTRTHNPKNVVVKKRVWKKRIKGHFKCAHCPWTGSGLSKHWKFEHPEEPLPFLCHLCDHRSCDEYYLKHHIRSVHGDKIYKCDICGKESKHNLAPHMKTHKDHKVI